MLLDELVLADGLAELDALGGVAHRVLEGALGRAERLGACDEALHLEVHHSLHEAVALDAHEVLLLQLHVLHVQLAGVAHVPADLLQRLDGDALSQVALVVVQRHPPHGEAGAVGAILGIVVGIARHA